MRLCLKIGVNSFVWVVGRYLPAHARLGRRLQGRISRVISSFPAVDLAALAADFVVVFVGCAAALVRT
jgi:hypothetical protein